MREQLIERARELSETRSNRQVALQLGVSPNTVGRWLNPDLAERDRATSRAWKRSTTGTCKTCGGVTHYNGGPGKLVSDECAACAQTRQHEERYWTAERVIAAIQRFAAEHGRPPVATVWLYGSHGIEGDGYPYATTVLRECGSWANAIEAAGFERPQIGAYERTSEHREALAARKRKPVEEYLERIRVSSVNGVAPSTDDPRVRSAYESLRRRGISWGEACELAGVRPRRA